MDVRLPDGTIVRGVPDGISQSELVERLQRNGLQVPESWLSAPKKGYGAAAMSGLESLISGGRTAYGAITGDATEAAKAGLERNKERARTYPSEVSWDKVTQKFNDPKGGLLPAAGEVLRQVPYAIAEQAPNLAAQMAGAKLGAMAGTAVAGPVGAVVGGVGGALVPTGLQLFGSNLERQAQESPDAPVSAGRAAATAVPQAALEVAGTAFLMGRRVVGSLLGEGVEAALKAGNQKAAEALAKEGLVKALAKGTARGAVSEPTTEVLQQMLERAQAGLPLTTPDAFKEYGETAYQSALLAPVGGAGRVAERGGARAELQAKKEAEDAAARAKQAQLEEQRRSDPAYALGVEQRYLDAEKQFAALQAAIPKKGQGGAAGDVQRAEAYKAAGEFRRDVLAPAAAEYAALKPRIEKLKEEQRRAGMHPMDVLMESAGNTPAPSQEELAARAAAEKKRTALRAPDRLDSLTPLEYMMEEQERAAQGLPPLKQPPAAEDPRFAPIGQQAVRESMSPEEYAFRDEGDKIPGDQLKAEEEARVASALRMLSENPQLMAAFLNDKNARIPGLTARDDFNLRKQLTKYNKANATEVLGVEDQEAALRARPLKQKQDAWQAQMAEQGDANAEEQAIREDTQARRVERREAGDLYRNVFGQDSTVGVSKGLEGTARALRGEEGVDPLQQAYITDREGVYLPPRQVQGPGTARVEYTVDELKEQLRDLLRKREAMRVGQAAQSRPGVDPQRFVRDGDTEEGRLLREKIDLTLERIRTAQDNGGKWVQPSAASDFADRSAGVTFARPEKKAPPPAPAQRVPAERPSLTLTSGEDQSTANNARVRAQTEEGPLVSQMYDPREQTPLADRVRDRLKMLLAYKGETLAPDARELLEQVQANFPQDAETLRMLDAQIDRVETVNEGGGAQETATPAERAKQPAATTLRVPRVERVSASPLEPKPLTYAPQLQEYLAGQQDTANQLRSDTDLFPETLATTRSSPGRFQAYLDSEEVAAKRKKAESAPPADSAYAAYRESTRLQKRTKEILSSLGVALPRYQRMLSRLQKALKPVKDGVDTIKNPIAERQYLKRAREAEEAMSGDLLGAAQAVLEARGFISESQDALKALEQWQSVSPSAQLTVAIKEVRDRLSADTARLADIEGQFKELDQLAATARMEVADRTAGTRVVPAESVSPDTIERYRKDTSKLRNTVETLQTELQELQRKQQEEARALKQMREAQERAAETAARETGLSKGKPPTEIPGLTTTRVEALDEQQRAGRELTQEQALVLVESSREAKNEPTSEAKAAAQAKAKKSKNPIKQKAGYVTQLNKLLRKIADAQAAARPSDLTIKVSDRSLRFLRERDARLERMLARTKSADARERLIERIDTNKRLLNEAEYRLRTSAPKAYVGQKEDFARRAELEVQIEALDQEIERRQTDPRFAPAKKETTSPVSKAAQAREWAQKQQAMSDARTGATRLDVKEETQSDIIKARKSQSTAFQGNLGPSGPKQLEQDQKDARAAEVAANRRALEEDTRRKNEAERRRVTRLTRRTDSKLEDAFEKGAGFESALAAVRQETAGLSDARTTNRERRQEDAANFAKDIAPRKDVGVGAAAKEAKRVRAELDAAFPDRSGYGGAQRVSVFGTLDEAAQSAGMTHNPRMWGWEVDGIPVSRKTRGFVKDGQVYLVAENIPEGMALPVLLHELGAHIGFRNAFTKTQFNALYNAVMSWANRPPGSTENKIYLTVMQRVQDAKTPDSQIKDEVVAYAVEVANAMGVKPEASKSPAASWLKAVTDALRKALAKFIKNPEKLTPQQLVDMAYGAAHMELAGAKPMKNSMKPSQETLFSVAPATYASGLEESASLANDLIARDKTYWEKLTGALGFGNKGLGFRTQFIDAAAPIEKVGREQMDALKATQMMYYIRMFGQKNNFVAQAAQNGVAELKKMTRKDGRTEWLVESKNSVGLKDVVTALKPATAKAGSAQAAQDLFSTYLVAQRAKSVGLAKLDLDQRITQQRIDKVTQEIKDKGLEPVFKDAASLYNKYNRDLIGFATQTGFLSKDLASRLLATGDYVPYYRERGGNYELMIGNETPIRIGDVKDAAHLKELVGGDQKIIDFMTSAVMNTSMLMDASLRNLAARNVAYELQEIGGAKILKADKSKRVQGPNVISFFDDGTERLALVDTDKFGVPADLLVKGLAGIPTMLPTAVRLAGIPSQVLRKGVTLSPLYMARQLFRDSLNVMMTTGANPTRVLAAVRQIGKHSSLENRGVTGGQVFTGDNEDVSMILRSIASDKDNVHTLLAKAEAMAMQADASVRHQQYQSMLDQGLSEMEATLMSLESMNFNKRGVSPSVHYMSTLIPFFNAQIQGLDVLYKAFTGKMPMSEKLRIREKLFARGMTMMAFSLAYASAMQDDEAYQNALPDEKYGNWFVRIPGVDQAVRLPIPFELGYIFKALPEAIVNSLMSDAGAEDAKAAFGNIIKNVIPGGSSYGVPQAIKPMLEAYANKSTFTGAPIESRHEQTLLPEARFRDNTGEAAKALGAATGTSPIMIESLIRGYTGTMGLALTQALGFAWPQGDTPDRAVKRMSDMPVVGPLFQPNDGQGIVSAVYAKLKDAQQVKATLDEMLNTGRRAEAKEFYQKNVNALAAAEAGGDFTQAMTKLTQFEKAVKASARTAQEKREMLDMARQKRIAIAREMRALLEKTERRASL